MVSLEMVLLSVACAAGGAVVAEPFEYRHGDLALEGYLAYDGATEDKRPGVLIVHEWWGVGDHVKDVAERLAKLGYVAFALDMYGKGSVTEDPQQAAKWSGQFKQDPALAKSRFSAALAVLRGNPRVDPRRVAAIGFCFGGTMVLEMARSGVDVAGVVSFHGGLESSVPEGQRDVKAKVLVCNGAADPMVSADALATFKQEMTDAGADWQLIEYGGAVHSFTNPKADGSWNPGVAYNADADRRSWQAMVSFFEELFSG